MDDESDLLNAVRHALDVVLGASPDQLSVLARLEMELPNLIGQQYPHSDGDLILRLVRDCVAEARSRIDRS